MTTNDWNKSSILLKNITRKERRRIIELYNACKDNDIINVSKYILSMHMKEINYQNPIDGNTILHEATQFGFAHIIKVLLSFGATRTLYNNNGKTPIDLAQTNDIRQCFERPHSESRFLFDSNNRLSKSSNDIKCKSCSLINDQSLYEWELIGNLAYQKNALRLRNELRPRTFNHFLEKAIFSIDKGYLKTHFTHLKLINSIRDWFKKAGEEKNPLHILTAYSVSQEFTKQLNADMARNVNHDLTNGCSLFSCDCLYSTQDATRSITAILLYHREFESLNFAGEVYRGLSINKSTFDHYTKGSRIITTTLLSTSKNRMIGEIFGAWAVPGANVDDISVLCIYTIKNQNRTAIYIAQHSQIKDEEEVLILPYSSFDIIDIKKNNDQKQTEIYLEECDATLLNL